MFTGLLLCLQINGCMINLSNTKFYGDNRPILASYSLTVSGGIFQRPSIATMQLE